jgi:tRNA G18 (ribose-2'-O)-methylase SpoU
MRRAETRRQRYEEKSKTAKTMPVSFCAVSFGIDENLALTIRTAACYGAESVMVIGSLPDHAFLRPRSGTTVDYVKVLQFSTPHDFLEHCRERGYNIVSAELCDGATDINNYRFDMTRHTVIVMGNEYTGVPTEVIHHSDPIFIPMHGTGYSLNVAMTSVAFIHEYQRQFVLNKRSLSHVAA